MPTPPLDEPTTRITVTLYTSDVALVRRVGHWTISEIVRDLLRIHCDKRRRLARWEELK